MVAQVVDRRDDRREPECGDRIPTGAVAQECTPTGVLLDAVVLDHDAPLRVREIAARNEPAVGVAYDELHLGFGKALIDEGSRKVPFGSALRRRSSIRPTAHDPVELRGAGPSSGRE